VKYAKTGWPRLSRYRIFRELTGTVRNLDWQVLSNSHTEELRTGFRNCLIC
jgi:hypothetical protein